MVSAENRVRVGVLVSGRGTNLEALCAAAASPDFPAHLVLVISNRGDAGALEIAARRGIPAEVMALSQFEHDGQARDRAMRDRLRLAGVELVVCAGYNRILTDEFLAAFPDAILNVHPSLLPAFGGGMHAVEEALEYGVKITGCTVQLLEPGIPDGGPIIVQRAVEVREDDDPESLRQRIHEQEWIAVPQAVRLWCEGRLRRQGRVVRIAGGGQRVTP
ncbi:MAG TPA: phosphoribosylglycinamide formyltransferase [Candidatus Binatia bacterium]|nr:phosphoribosylglycinamide formyltransferase [Candidatus Binatia bacterium]